MAEIIIIFGTRFFCSKHFYVIDLLDGHWGCYREVRGSIIVLDTFF